MSRTLACEVCVIGAGAGGAVLAAELAEAGVKVVLLEQGPHHSPDGFTARPPQMLARLYRDAGQTVTLGNPPVLLPLGSGLGGTTLVNSGTCFRTPPAVLRAWRDQLGLHIDERELDTCFARVEAALSVSEVAPELAGGNAEVARRGAQRLRWSHGYLRRNAKGCVGSGVCAFGCPTSAKQHTGITYVPRAIAAGAQVLTGATVLRVVMQGRRVSHVEAVLAGGEGIGGGAGQDEGVGGHGEGVGGQAGRGDSVGGHGEGVGGQAKRGDSVGGRARRSEGFGRRGGRGERIEVRAQQVVIAAGTIHTPGLLARSGLGGGSGQLGRNLSIHPATAAFALMEERVDMGRGVPQSFYVDEFAADGIMLEGVAGPPSYAAMSLPLQGERHEAAMARYPHLAQFGLMVSDSSRGSVRFLASARAGRIAPGRVRALAALQQTPLIRYDLDDADLDRFRLGLQRLKELFVAAGAREVYLPLPEGVEPSRARRGDLRLMGFHPLGTARADPRPSHGVVDGDLRLHGAEDVYVADGSVIPSSLGVNPQLTIMALASRLAFRMLGRPVPGSQAGPMSGRRRRPRPDLEGGPMPGREDGADPGVEEIPCPS